MPEEKTYIGTSGFMYKHWHDGVFYPKDLKQDKWLSYYCDYLDSVELNVTFYRLPLPSVIDRWHNNTPKDFTFSAKGSRFITHTKLLKDPLPNLEKYFSTVKRLKNKLSVVLWQLPPKFEKDLDRLSNFVKHLKKIAPCRQAFEFRHPSWFCNDVFNILKSENIAICRADWPECSKNAPFIADFVYIRKHGATGMLYGGCYSESQLKNEALTIRNTRKDYYIYFNNDAQGWAVKNAVKLKEIIK